MNFKEFGCSIKCGKGKGILSQVRENEVKSMRKQVRQHREPRNAIESRGWAGYERAERERGGKSLGFGLLRVGTL